MKCCLSLLLLLAGCTASHLPPAGVATPATQNTAEPIPKDRILVKFETLDCFCSLGDVERALLEMEAVSALDWEVSNNKLWLVFVDDRRPTDEQIRTALRYAPVKIKEVKRP